MRELQKKIQDFILSGNNENIHDAIKVPEQIDRKGRLNIYRNGYYERVVKALKQDFPMLLSLMGGKTFYGMACAYIDAFPSTHYSLHPLGKNLAGFLRKIRDCHPSFAELAELEYLVVEIKNSVDAPHLTSVESENVFFKLHPSLRFFTEKYNTVQHWLSSCDIELNRNPKTYLLWRYQNSVHHWQVDNRQLAFFTLICEHNTLNQICEKLSAHFKDDEMVPWLIQLLQESLLLGVFTYNKRLDPKVLT